MEPVHDLDYVESKQGNGYFEETTSYIRNINGKLYYFFLNNKKIGLILLYKTSK